MINPSDILQLCRLCLVEDAVNHSIFEDSGDLRSIFLKISSCLPVSIHKDDGLPEKICETCSTKLDTFYQFWNETANAEKQLLQWLKQTTTKKSEETIKKMDATEVKQEETEESNMDPIDMSSDAQTYILQQQQLPYASAPTDSINTSESDEPVSKRPRRASAVRALEQMESEDEDDPDVAPDNYAKTESDDSEKEEEEDNDHQENPSITSMEEQPGPSGIVKKRVVLDDTPMSSAIKVKPCHIVLNDIKGLLGADGFYTVPGRSRKALTCYRCFKKFFSAEALEMHKAEHEPESGEEDVYAVSDSENEIEAESETTDEEKKPNEPAARRNSRSPGKKQIDYLKEKKSMVESNEIKIEYVPKPPEPMQQRQVQVVGPIMAKPRTNVDNTATPQQSTDVKKVPVLCNIQIKCLSCDVLFTNSELLMQHTPLDAGKPCCFTCKVCSESYSQPSDYLEHIMQHNTFSSSRYGYRGGAPRKKPEFRCTYCQKEFEHRFLLKHHEENEHKKETQSTVTPQVIVIADTDPPPKPKEILPKPIKIVAKVKEILPKPIENIPTKPMEDEKNLSGASQITTAPKIWVIKEALMKSPEPKAPNEQKSLAVTPTVGAKRKLDDIVVVKDALKPAKRGRSSKASGSQIAVEKSVDQVSNLTCDECFDVFDSKAAFDEHMVFHEANKDGVVVATSNSSDGGEFPCNLCNMQFKSVAGLRRHQSCIHEKMTSFVCSECSKIFSSRKGLNIHRSFCTGSSSRKNC